MFFASIACGTGHNDNSSVPVQMNAASSEQKKDNTAGIGAEAESSEIASSTDHKRMTIIDHFMLLPETYFVLEGCDRAKDKGCIQAKKEYLKTFAVIQDIKNGYLKGGCDGGQACLDMTIFRRKDNTYLVAVATVAEDIMQNYFLDLKDGKWTDVSSDVVPNFDKNKVYELPRVGTTVNVYNKNIIDQGSEMEFAERGEKLYELTWNGNKFEKKK